MQKENNFILTCIIYLISMFLLVCIHILGSLGCFNFVPDKVLEVVLSVIPQIIIMLLIPFLILYYNRKKENKLTTPVAVLKETGLGKISFKFVMLAFVLGICLYILNIFVASFFANILDSFGYQFTSSSNTFSGVWGLVISLILTAVLPGICEEFLHRGVLLNGLVKKMGVFRAVLCVSIIFGLMHMNIAQFFFTTVLGWFLCVSVLTSKSLWVGIIIHFTNNAISVYMSYSSELGLPGAEILQNVFSNPIIFVLAMIVIFVVVGGIFRHMAKVNFEKNVDIYTVKYLSTQTKFSIEEFDKVKVALGSALKSLPTWKAIFAYIETYESPKKMEPLEKALFLSIFILGGILTILSFWWGTL